MSVGFGRAMPRVSSVKYIRSDDLVMADLKRDIVVLYDYLGLSFNAEMRTGLMDHMAPCHEDDEE